MQRAGVSEVAGNPPASDELREPAQRRFASIDVHPWPRRRGFEPRKSRAGFVWFQNSIGAGNRLNSRVASQPTDANGQRYPIECPKAEPPDMVRHWAIVCLRAISYGETRTRTGDTHDFQSCASERPDGPNPW